MEEDYIGEEDLRQRITGLIDSLVDVYNIRQSIIKSRINKTDRVEAQATLSYYKLVIEIEAMCKLYNAYFKTQEAQRFEEMRDIVEYIDQLFLEKLLK